LREDLNLKFFEPIGSGTISAVNHENTDADFARGLRCEITLPVRCLLDLPDDPAFQRETTISLSLIRLGHIGWDALPGKSFVFPVNPAAGYVDGSIYFVEQHHYVDLVGLQFGSVRGDVIETGLEMTFNFYPIPEVPKLPSQFQVLWNVMLKLDVNAIK
jgi:hypothetical protein